MSQEAHDESLRLMDELREMRRAGSSPDQEWSILDRLEDLYAQLTEAEIVSVELQGWRAWPEEYDKHHVG